MGETSRASGAAGPWGLVGAVLLLAIGLLVLLPALRADPGQRAERPVLVQDRVVDGSLPASQAFSGGYPPATRQPLARLLLREQMVLWGSNPVGFRLGSWLLTLLVALGAVALLRRLDGGRPWLGGALVLASPVTVAAALWYPAQGTVLATLLVLGAALACVSAWQWMQRGEGGERELFWATCLAVAAVLVGPPGQLAILPLLAIAALPGSRLRTGAGLAALAVAVAGTLGQLQTALVLVADLDAGAWLGRLLQRAGALVPGCGILPPDPPGLAGVGSLTLVVIALLLGLLRTVSSAGSRLTLGLLTLAGLVLVGAGPAGGGEEPGLAEALILWVGFLVGLGLTIGPRPTRWSLIAMLLLLAGGGYLAWSAAAAHGDHEAQLRRTCERYPGHASAHLHLARQLAVEDRLEEAVTVLERALEYPELGQRDEHQLELARLLGQQASSGVAGVAQRATELASAVLEGREGAARAQAFLVRAQAQLALDPPGWRAARRDLLDAERLLPADDPGQLELNVLLGYVRAENGEELRAEEAYRRALEVDPRSFMASYLYGNLLVARADRLERREQLAAAGEVRLRAVQHLWRAYRSREVPPGGLHTRLLVIQLGGTLGKMGRTREAREVLERGLEQWPDDPHILFNHAMTLLAQDRPLAAETEMLTALRQAEQQGLPEVEFLREQVWEHLVRRGNDMLKGADVKEAEGLAVQAVEVAPRSFPARILLGDVRFAQGRYDLAINQYDRAIELEPESYPAHAKRAHAFRKRGLLRMVLMSQIKLDPQRREQEWHQAREGAIADLEEFLRVLPHDDEAPGAHQLLAALERARYREEPEAPSLSAQEQAILQRQQARARERWEEGVNLFEAGDPCGAVEAFTSALSYYGREAAYLYWKGRALRACGGEDLTALHLLERALREDPTVWQTYYELGELYYELGTGQLELDLREDPTPSREELRTRARTHLDSFLRLAPGDDPRVELSRARLLDLREPR